MQEFLRLGLVHLLHVLCLGRALVVVGQILDLPAQEVLARTVLQGRAHLVQSMGPCLEVSLAEAASNWVNFIIVLVVAYIICRLATDELNVGVPLLGNSLFEHL